jgi:hypothetical protein
VLELPGLHGAASRTAGSAKRTYLRLILFSLLALIGAAAAGAVGGKVAAVIAVALFLVASSLRFYLVANRPEKEWYDGRAIAESVKTLSWRYAVGGEPFRISLEPANADRQYIERLRRLLGSLQGIYLPRKEPGSAEITASMREARLLPLDARRDLYVHGRLDDQEQWYAGRAAFHHGRYKLWAAVTLLLEFAGVIGGVLVVATDANIDVLGIFAAAAAAGIAWIETNQHANLAHSYSNAAQELAALRALVPHVTSDDAWADFVATAEEAVSREHVSWAAAGGSTTAELIRSLARAND